MIAFKLPSLGSDMDQGKLLEWKVKLGDRVKRGDVIAIVDTSKAAVDVEIWSDGTVSELLVKPGETVPVGTVLATLLAPGETPESALPIAPEPAPQMKVAAIPAAAAAVPGVSAKPGVSMRRRISPAARRRAEELGVGIDAVPGTGPDLAVTLEDVERAAVAKFAPPDRAAEMRRAIAAAMSRSKREIPHYYLADTISLERAAAWLAGQNAQRPVPERLLMAVLYLKAVALACVKFPEMNGFYRDGGFLPSAAVHVGVAISLRKGGLVAPALHDVEKKTLVELMHELSDLVQRARAGSLRSSEMTDPTITVTNLGDGGVESVFGVIYPPQVALVGFGRVVERAWAEHGTLSVVPTVTASLAADHRVSDGHRGALFVSAIRELLQQPQKL